MASRLMGFPLAFASEYRIAAALPRITNGVAIAFATSPELKFPNTPGWTFFAEAVRKVTIASFSNEFAAIGRFKERTESSFNPFIKPVDFHPIALPLLITKNTARGAN